jgi:hypothetical protein
MRDRKVEEVVGLNQFEMTGALNNWFGLAPDDSPLLLKNRDLTPICPGAAAATRHPPGEKP